MRRRREECSAIAKDSHDFESETEAVPLSIAISAHPAYLFAPFFACTASIEWLWMALGAGLSVGYRHTCRTVRAGVPLGPG